MAAKFLVIFLTAAIFAYFGVFAKGVPQDALARKITTLSDAVHNAFAHRDLPRTKRETVTLEISEASMPVKCRETVTALQELWLLCKAYYLRLGSRYSGCNDKDSDMKRTFGICLTYSNVADRENLVDMYSNFIKYQYTS
ncbi:uncharacterized protein LOC129584380 [Paramacrobiotus metropolitanus]|uniref:uncharacterized protein LOC129584380 n=1 Tax=Paramacrobiotus metropolitanus TaxID=2943436 RepID=UPI002446520D|nr:uncharacterized protein LOC129584380 [Paramacrobiotus metropolitanus]